MTRPAIDGQAIPTSRPCIAHLRPRAHATASLTGRVVRDLGGTTVGLRRRLHSVGRMRCHSHSAARGSHHASFSSAHPHRCRVRRAGGRRHPVHAGLGGSRAERRARRREGGSREDEDALPEPVLQGHRHVPRRRRRIAEREHLHPRQAGQRAPLRQCGRQSRPRLRPFGRPRPHRLLLLRDRPRRCLPGVRRLPGGVRDQPERQGADRADGDGRPRPGRRLHLFRSVSARRPREERREGSPWRDEDPLREQALPGQRGVYGQRGRGPVRADPATNEAGRRHVLPLRRQRGRPRLRSRRWELPVRRQRPREWDRARLRRRRL